jgi:hypothetical protein
MRRYLATAGAFTLLVGGAATASAHEDSRQAGGGAVLVADHLDNPRQLAWAGQTLLVAEAGRGAASGCTSTGGGTTTPTSNATSTSDTSTSPTTTSPTSTSATSTSATSTSPTTTSATSTSGSAGEATLDCVGDTGSITAIRRAGKVRYGVARTVVSGLHSVAAGNGTSAIGPDGVAATGLPGVLVIAEGEQTFEALSTGTDAGSQTQEHLLLAGVGPRGAVVPWVDLGDVEGRTNPGGGTTDSNPNQVVVVDPTPYGPRGADEYVLVADAGANVVWKVVPDFRGLPRACRSNHPPNDPAVCLPKATVSVFATPTLNGAGTTGGTTSSSSSSSSSSSTSPTSSSTATSTSASTPTSTSASTPTSTSASTPTSTSAPTPTVTSSTSSSSSSTPPTPPTSTTQSVPTSLALDGDGHVYVGLAAGLVPGAAQVVRYDLARGRESGRWSGFTAINGLAVDRGGRHLYVSQVFGPQGPPSGTGSVLRVDTRANTFVSFAVPTPAGLVLANNGTVLVAANSVLPATAPSPDGLGTGGQIRRFRFPGGQAETPLPGSGGTTTGTPTSSATSSPTVSPTATTAATSTEDSTATSTSTSTTTATTTTSATTTTTATTTTAPSP